MKYVITGSTLAGNLGGAVMIAAAVQEIKKHDSDARFELLSYIPAQCSEVNHGFADFKVISADYRWLILVYFPLSILLYPFLKLSIVEKTLRFIPYFESLYDSDAVVDLAGISFVDGRGLPLLIYNAACVFPALGVGKKVFKLSQALGPFKTSLNRLSARFILSRCEVVVARGTQSFDHCKQLGLKNAYHLPDSSFGLEITSRHKAKADKILSDANISGSPIIFSPSEVLRREMSAASMDFEKSAIALIKKLDEAGHEVLILPHSISDDETKNNDLPVSIKLKESLGDRVKLITGVKDPSLMRAILSRAVVHVGCRFHSVVGALSMGTPTLIVSWSHKYDEMVSPICGNDYVVKWQHFEGERTAALVLSLIENQSDVRKNMLKNLKNIKARSKKNFRIVVEGATD